MDIWKCMYERRSIRRFQRRKNADPKDIDYILDAARYAWDPYETQPWRFILVKDKEVKKMLANFAMEIAHYIFGVSYEIFRGHVYYLESRRVPAIAEYAQSGELWKYPMDASFTIIPCVSNGAWIDEFLRSMVTLNHTSIGTAIQNMWLAGENIGWGSGCNAMPLNDARRREELCELLGIPGSWLPAAAYCFGKTVFPRFAGPSRMPLEAIAFSEMWGNRYIRSGFRDAPQIAEPPEMDIMDAIHGTDNVWEFKKEMVPEWKIEQMLDVQRWSPNPENLNHWRHVIIQDEETKNLVNEITKETWDAMHKNSYSVLKEHYGQVPDPKFLEYLESIRENYWKIAETADTLILTSFAKVWVEYAGGAGTLPGWDGIDHIWGTATGCGIQNMRLAATALGLGTNMNVLPLGEYRRGELLMDLLGIPRTWIPVSLMCVGVPKSKDKYKSKKTPLDTLVYDEYWGNPHTLAEEVA